jgi:hypothetical protein
MSIAITWFRVRRATSMSVVALASVGLYLGTVHAQSTAVELHIPQASQSASAATTATRWYHILPARTDAGRAARRSGLGTASAPSRTGMPTLASTLPSNPRFFPADLSYFGGNVVLSAESMNIYVDCGNSDSCWGSPTQFLADLGASKFIHLLDQYVGSHAKDRYTLSPTSFVAQTGASLLTLADVENIVHQAAQIGGAGLNHIYHLFLPQGIDVCMDAKTCYSPDNAATFLFCAFHSDVAFNDTGDILYTVEPFQDVPGCAVAPPNPNGQLADSTNSVLSHELFETITDPQGDGWFAASSGPESGNEVADVCQGVADVNDQEIVPTYVLVARKPYQTQLEYSNKTHRCATKP